MAEYRLRALAATIRRALATSPAILVTGARQTGTTTLLRTEFDNTHGYASLERPDVRARALADPVSFLSDHPSPVVLDEIQYAPELLPFIKERIDTDRQPGQWILSGSQSFPLMRGVSETLDGRTVSRARPFGLSRSGMALTSRRSRGWAANFMFTG